MGWNTTVVVMNDALDWIRNDPEFGKKLVDAIQRLQAEPGPLNVSARKDLGVFTSAARVIETHHADDVVIVCIGGNDAKILGRHRPIQDMYGAEGQAKIVKSLV